MPSEVKFNVDAMMDIDGTSDHCSPHHHHPLPFSHHGHPGTHHHPLSVEVNLNQLVVRRSKTPTSPNPLDNENLKRQSTGLSAFNDYVDLVKRHLMYAVREEVEILKQQIGEMMERIGQLEYENTVLRSEAKPETLNKLLLPRATQPQAALPGSQAGMPAAAGGVQPQPTALPSSGQVGMGGVGTTANQPVASQPSAQPQQPQVVQQPAPVQQQPAQQQQQQMQVPQQHQQQQQQSSSQVGQQPST